MVSSHLKIELFAAPEDRQTGGVVVHGATSRGLMEDEGSDQSRQLFHCSN